MINMNMLFNSIVKTLTNHMLYIYIYIQVAFLKINWLNEVLYIFHFQVIEVINYIYMLSIFTYYTYIKTLM
jgi:hypothetical protein